MERDLRTLRRSKLMNYSEFRVMTTALERYYKDVKIAILIGKKTAKDLDMRPYLYDEGDPYEKPFYGTLLKMLSEVATSKYFDKQHEDVLKIYKWYKANRKLITSPPKIPIPTSPQKNDRNSDGGESVEDEDDEEEEELKELSKVPKLHLRPKTAPSVESRKGTRYVTWNEAQQQSAPRRASSASKQRSPRSKDTITVSLRISPYGPHSRSSDGQFMDSNGISDGYILRPGTAPAVFRKSKGRINPEGLKSFILRPSNSSPAPFSSPVTSPLSSPRDSPVPTSRTKQPLSAHFTPEIVKEPSMKLSSRVPKNKSSEQINGERKMSISSDENSSTEGSHSALNGIEHGEQSKQYTVSKHATPSELEEILTQQKKEEKLLEEQHDLLQKKLLHDYDHYIQDMGTQQKQVGLEIVDGQVSVTGSLQESRQTVHPAPVGTYDLSAPEIVPSYNRIYSERNTDGHSRSHSDNGIQRSTISPSRHVRHGTVPQKNPQDVIKVDAVLGMITPIGLQMEYDRERMIGQNVASGLRKPATVVQSRSLPTQSIVTSPLSAEWASVPGSPRDEPTPQTSCEQDTTSLESHVSGSFLRSSTYVHHDTRDGFLLPRIPQSNFGKFPRRERPTSDTSDNRSMELKFKEPELSPDRTPRDYLVHFPQDKSLESSSSKNFKTSGPVVPDTIRYQWTDDGFGNRTYLKKLKTPTSPRSTRKKPQPTQQVTMPTGSRSLDKRTLASLVVVRQLGDADRRNIDRIAGAQNGNVVMGPDQDSLDYAYHLEYLSFCQPVGPRLGESEKPSSVNWYLQGEHGLYREPTRSTEISDDFRHHRSEVRIPKDTSLMIEGHHFGAGEHKREEGEHRREEQPSWAQKELSSPSTISLESLQSTKESISLRPSSPARPSSPSVRKFIPIPTGGRSSRPSSARSATSCHSHNHDKTPNFSVKDFKHFCWPDEYLLSEDYVRQREVWAAVNIQRIFRGFMARQFMRDMREANAERERKAAVTLQSNFRGFLARRREMEQNLRGYTPTSRSLEWARQYKQGLKKRGDARKHKNQYALFKQSKEAEKQEQQLKQVKAHQHIFDVFHPTPEGPTKAQMKAAAITIQRYFRGWFVRRMFAKSKAKALKRTLSFNKFIKGYQALLYRIQKRYGVKEPSTALEFNELMEYVERLNKYEVAFDKFTTNGILHYKDLKEFFKTLGVVPSQKEIDEAIELVTKMSAKGRDLTKAEAVEVLFQIYVPKGTKLKMADIRKSTWLNPLDDGRDIMQLLSKKDLEETNLLRCLEVVAGAGRESEDIQSLLRPGLSKEPVKKQEGKKKSSSKQPRKSTVLAQYPMRPSTPTKKSPRPPSGKKPSKR